MNRDRWSVGGLLFGSGFCALIYQTVWLRELRLIFGASTAATAAVLAIFMAGLGIGSAVLGRRADAKASPLAFYGRLEIAIALSAALTPVLLIVVRTAYLATGGSANWLAGTVARLVLSSIVLGVPTVLMGGTLPAAARAVEGSEDVGRRRLALLYGLNTLGAVVGTLVSTFYLLERLGNRNTLWVAAAINVVIGFVAIAMPRGAMAASAIEETQAPEAAAAPLGRSIVLVAAAITGFAFLQMELVWYRMLSPLLGGTTFMFGLILAVALAGIGLGGAAYSLWGRGQATPGGFALTCALEALAMIVPFALGDRLALLAVLLRPLGIIGFGGHVLAWTAITTIVVFPAALIAGIQFPMLISLLGRGRENVGRDVGLTYAANTGGSIAGSLLGGFLLIPYAGALGCWQLVVFLLAALSVCVLLPALRARQFAAGGAAIAAALLAVLATRAIGPTAAWRHSGIGVNRFAVPASLNEARDRIAQERRTVVADVDGRESSIALVAEVDLSLIINGKSDGSARGDAGTQVMGGVIPMLLHPQPRRALVIGLGTGTTAGWLGASPDMERVDAIEIEPDVVAIAPAFAAVNRDAMRNPKIVHRVADAREVLLTTTDRYDVIFSEPSNPYRAGIASLYTREFYEAARGRLERGGIFAQWLQTYSVDSATARTVYATLTSVFPHVETWWTVSNDLILLASSAPIVHDADAIRARLATSPYREAARVAWRTATAEGVLAHFGAANAFSRELARNTPLNTDDRTTIEFSFARTLSSAGLSTDGLFREAAQRGHGRPDTLRGAIDWEAVAAERATHTFLTSSQPRHRLAQAYERGNLRAAAAIFRGSPWRPVNGADLARVAESLADSGDEGAMPFVDALRQWQPIEADAALARLRLRQRRLAEAAELIERAFVAYRANPWPAIDVMRNALDTATELAAADRASAPRIFAALEQPFAARLLNDGRLLRRLAVAEQIGKCSPAMVTALQALEPHVPWRRHILVLRAECYSGEPAEAARRDVARFDAAR